MPPPCLVRRLSTLSTMSTVHRGTAYEQWSMRVLQSCLSMSLIRVGGRADGGIDLQGWWWLPSHHDAEDHPSSRRRIRVLAQCKAEKKKIGPKYVREMEGVLHQFNSKADTDPSTSNSRSDVTVGLFISSSPFSKLTLRRATSSSLPLALLHLPSPTEELLAQEESCDGPLETDHIPPDAIGSMVFNAALGGTSGVLQGEIEPRWEYPMRGGTGRPTLWWRGRRLPNHFSQDGLFP
ncbi:hypothetical protein BC835DRAFT_259838 [Cytidiella melzeri]|nr:hypothetical protein BC835DRAFT_259838 [Cytidiella melzeri]